MGGSPHVDQELYFRRRLIFGTYSFCRHCHDECSNGRKKAEYQCPEGRKNVHPASLCFSGIPRFRAEQGIVIATRSSAEKGLFGVVGV